MNCLIAKSQLDQIEINLEQLWRFRIFPSVIKYDHEQSSLNRLIDFCVECHKPEEPRNNTTELEKITIHRRKSIVILNYHKWSIYVVRVE